ncbi:MAG: adenylate/guanylate cyclase domain-containing protein [Alphaproteobacteria bacterium]
MAPEKGHRLRQIGRKAAALFGRYYRLVVLVGVAAVAGAAAALLSPLPVDGLVYDLIVMARGTVVGERLPPSDRVAVIALDDRSLDSAEMKSMPRTFLSPQWAKLLDVLESGGARVVAFDLLFVYSANAFIPNYDRPLLGGFARHRGRVVIARSGATVPAAPFQFALNVRGDPTAMGMADLVSDSDGSVRTVPAGFPGPDGVFRPGLAAAALAKAGARGFDAPVMIAPTAPLERLIPAFSMIDVLHCADQVDSLRKALEGRIVFVGTTLPDEDRKFAADRLLLVGEPEPPPTAAVVSGCRLDPLPLSSPASGTVPGVFIHAAAVDAVLRGHTIRPASPWAVGGVTALTTLLVGTASLVLRPVLAAGAAGLLLTGLFGGAAGLLTLGVWMPISGAFFAFVPAMASIYASRYMVEDRRRRKIQRAFGHYLSPNVVARLSEAETDPLLGGELRELTVMFADLSGFTALSGRVSPHELMELTNHYLSLVVAAVEETGGYVDKFIGDAVMAFWGAPADDPDHAQHAARTACLAATNIARERAAALARGEFGFSVKIGLHSGPAVVGNVGARQRFNYTAVGETVNIASRLEGLPGVYDCAVVLSAVTAAAIESEVLLCELDQVHVKGKTEPVTVFMPVAPLAEATAEHHAHVAAYQAALAAYRARDFATAAERWRAMSPAPGGCGPSTGGGPPQVMATRAETLAGHPPADGWDGVWTIPKG